MDPKRMDSERRDVDFNIIDFIDAQRPDWTEEQGYWMAVCELITQHWYFMLTMEEYAKLYQIRYPEVSAKTIRDAYVFQYYSEAAHRSDVFDDRKKRDTLLTPLVDENGVEYLASNQVEDEKDCAFENKVLRVRKEMYMPPAEEMEEYFKYGCNPSNKAIAGAIEELSNLVEIRNPESVDTTKKAIVGQTVVCKAILGFENGMKYEDVCKMILYSMPFVEDAKVIEQLRIVCNNTRIPGNRGHMPLEMG